MTIACSGDDPGVSFGVSGTAGRSGGSDEEVEDDGEEGGEISEKCGYGGGDDGGGL